MPLTSKGEEIKSNMEKEYGPKKGESVFYASKNAGKITGVDATSPSPASGPMSTKGESQKPPGQTLPPTVQPFSRAASDSGMSMSEIKDTFKRHSGGK